MMSAAGVGAVFYGDDIGGTDVRFSKIHWLK